MHAVHISSWLNTFASGGKQDGVVRMQPSDIIYLVSDTLWRHSCLLQIPYQFWLLRSDPFHPQPQSTRMSESLRKVSSEWVSNSQDGRGKFLTESNTLRLSRVTYGAAKSSSVQRTCMLLHDSKHIDFLFIFSVQVFYQPSIVDISSISQGIPQLSQGAFLAYFEKSFSPHYSSAVGHWLGGEII